jgi:hypothetical protein
MIESGTITKERSERSNIEYPNDQRVKEEQAQVKWPNNQ